MNHGHVVIERVGSEATGPAVQSAGQMRKDLWLSGGRRRGLLEVRRDR